MTVRELGSNFLENNRRFYSDDVPATPEQKAEEFMDVVFDTPEKALRSKFFTSICGGPLLRINRKKRNGTLLIRYVTHYELLYLSAAKQMMAKEIAFDPQVRKVMRREWEVKASVTVRPTERGMQVIDELHPYHVCAHWYF